MSKDGCWCWEKNQSLCSDERDDDHLRQMASTLPLAPAPQLDASSCTDQSEVLIDLVGLDVQSISPPQTSPASVPAALPWGPTDPLVPTPNTSTAGLSLLDQDLFSLGKSGKKKISLLCSPYSLCALRVYMTRLFDPLCSGLGQSVPENRASTLDAPRKQLVFKCAL